MTLALDPDRRKHMPRIPQSRQNGGVSAMTADQVAVAAVRKAASDAATGNVVEPTEPQPEPIALTPFVVRVKRTGKAIGYVEATSMTEAFLTAKRTTGWPAGIVVGSPAEDPLQLVADEDSIAAFEVRHAAAPTIEPTPEPTSASPEMLAVMEARNDAADDAAKRSEIPLPRPARHQLTLEEIEPEQPAKENTMPKTATKPTASKTAAQKVPKTPTKVVKPTANGKPAKVVKAVAASNDKPAKATIIVKKDDMLKTFKSDPNALNSQMVRVLTALAEVKGSLDKAELSRTSGVGFTWIAETCGTDKKQMVSDRYSGNGPLKLSLRKPPLVKITRRPVADDTKQTLVRYEITGTGRAALKSHLKTVASK